MSIPYFFEQEIVPVGAEQVLSEESSRHIIQVLRMTPGESIRLTDGRGRIGVGEIRKDHKKNCTVQIRSIDLIPPPGRSNTIAISLLKNNTRFEWFLEKAAELGIRSIVPLICSRTEKPGVRLERLQSILISAMLQSQQAWLTEIREPVRYKKFIDSFNGDKTTATGLIAHCEPGEKTLLSLALRDIEAPVTLMIGPEGDFTTEEIQRAIEKNFMAVSLGETRLRTETAGIAAASMLQLSSK